MFQDEPTSLRFIVTGFSMGYFTGENGTGEQITDTTGKSLKPWVIKENNHYYKPYEDYVTRENDYGLKLYAYYM